MAGERTIDGLPAGALEQLKIVFFQECEEHLGELEAGLLAIQKGEADSELLNSVFRAAHSIKGGAAAFGLDDLVQFAHGFESALSEVRDGKLAPEPPVVKLLLSAGDVLTDLVRAARDGGEVDTTRVESIGLELAALVDTPEEAMDDVFEGLNFTPTRVEFEPITIGRADDIRAWSIRFRPYADLYAKANDTYNLLRDLRALGDVDVELDDRDLPLLQDLEAEDSYLGWHVRLTTAAPEDEIRAVFEFVEGDCELSVECEISDDDIIITDAEPLLVAPPAFAAQPVPAAPAPPPAAAATPTIAPSPSAAPQTIRVDLDRVDKLIDLVSELVINQAMLAQRVADHGVAPNSSVALALEDLDQITRDIQDNVMAIRAQPVKTVFQRMSRLAREIEAMTGKQSHLVTEGETTEVDRTVIERLTDPLTHMVRNAIDHGLETAEERRAAGKTPIGTVKISAAHRAGRIIIEVKDDGRGMDRKRVRAKAIERGIIAADAVLADEETDNLIFMPGFSTAESISDLSGRGVGLDVVKRGVQSMGGRLTVSSRLGEGTTFHLSLPLTLAVLDGMVVSAGGQCLVAPLTTLVETVQPRPEHVRRLGPDLELLAVRGAHVPLIDLGVALGYPKEDPRPSTQRVALLVEDDAGARMALLVDDIVGQRQVVIKSLEANYRRVPGVAAATILGDGRVALILDVNAIIEGQRRDERQFEAA